MLWGGRLQWWSKGDFMIWAPEWEGAATNGQRYLPTSRLIYSLSVFHLSVSQLCEIHMKHKNLSSKCEFMKILNPLSGEKLLMEAGSLLLWVHGFLHLSLEKWGVEGKIGARKKDLLCLCCVMARRWGCLGRDFVRLDKTKLVGTLGSLTTDKSIMLYFISMFMFINI